MINKEIIKARVTEGLSQAKKVIEVLEIVGVPVDFGYIWQQNGAEFFYDKINQVVTVKMGPNYQLVAGLTTKNVTVYCGQTWISFLNAAYEKYVANKPEEDKKNNAIHLFYKNLDLKQ